MWDTATWDVSLWDAEPVLGGHFGFDEKKRSKRWQDEIDARQQRRDELVGAFKGEAAQIVSEYLAPQGAKAGPALVAAEHDDEDDIETLLVMGVL